MDKLYELKDQLIAEIAEYADKDRKTKEDALSLKALTGSADHLCNIIHGMEEGYSGYYPMGGSYRESHRGSYGRGGSYRDGSYARGRGRNANRDSMGRYSSEGYSRHGDMVDELRELMEDAPDERTRMEFQKLIQKLENA